MFVSWFLWALLYLIIKKSSKIKSEIFKNRDNGFYVHAPQTECKNPKQIKKIVNYVCRYAGHPAMSESRIIKYDKENRMIYYYYDPHEDDYDDMDAIAEDMQEMGIII